MSKLTLNVSEELVSAAKSEAKARQISVSKLVSDFFNSLTAKPTNTAPNVELLAPRTRRLLGCIPQTDADIEDYIAHLESKHS